MEVAFRFSSIWKVLADNSLPEPALRGATVKFDFDVVQTPGSVPKFMVDPETAKLELPRITKIDADALPDQFGLVVESPVEDTFGRAGTLQFKFAVQLTGRDEKNDGTVELKFNANVEGIKDVSRS